MTPKQAKRDCIAHWKRMIAWAEKQNKDDTSDTYHMRRAIGEHWKGDYCAYCGLFCKRNAHCCVGCPLYAAGYECMAPGNPWWSVEVSCTWKTWLVAARHMLAVLRRVKA